MHLIITDLDDTLNTVSEVRKHLAPQGEDRKVNANWADWHRAHLQEKPKTDNIRMVTALFYDSIRRGEDPRLAVWSTRDATYQNTTEWQLRLWELVHVDYWWLRAFDDDRQPVEMKMDKLRHLITALNPESVTIVDDDPVLHDSISLRRKMLEYKCPVQVIKVPQTGLRV